MAENGDSLPDDQRCKRSDGKKWRCRRPAMAGKTLCEAHFLQGRHRQHKEPVPETLKLERQKPPKKPQEISSNLDTDSPPKRAKRKVKVEESSVNGSSKKKGKKVKVKGKDEKSPVDFSEKLDDALKKMNLKKGDLQLDLIRGCLNRQVEKKKEKQPKKEDIVKELKYGRLEISQASAPVVSVNDGGVLNVKVGVPTSSSVPRRFFRSKNIDPLPIATVQNLPSIKANVKAAARRKCHWCRMSSYQVFIKCLTCKKQFFCEDCIQRRNLDKADVKKQCPVCCDTCTCRVCTRGRSKDAKTKDPVFEDAEVKFDKSQQLLYVIHLLLPLLEQINQEKIMELDMEAKIKGKNHSQLQIQLAVDSQKLQCCFCKSCIVDVHRSCGNCFYILCIPCCREFREGHLHRGLRDFKFMKTDKRKSLCTILWNWETCEDGSIKCPPKSLGGCGGSILDLLCVSPFSWSKDLEASAKEIIFNLNFSKLVEVDSSCCSLCDANDKTEIEKEGKILIEKKGLYFSTKQDFQDRNLEHFMKHWVKGQPLIVRDVVKTELELIWDPIFMFCTYLEKSTKSREDNGMGKSKTCSDWCEVEIGRQQIFMGGKTHANVWHEVLKFKVWLSSGFFQEMFPMHYDVVMRSLPLQEYFDPLGGLLNMAVKLPRESQSLDLGPFVYISYAGPEDIMKADYLSKLCYHAYDVVNILVHATKRQISEKKLNKVRSLMNKYSSQDPNESSRKNKTETNVDEQFGKSSFSSEVTELEDTTNGELTQIPNGETCVFSDDSSVGDSDDDDMGPDELESSRCHGGEPVDDTRGSQWDIFRREDVSKIVEYLKKYSNELNQSYSSPKKVVHPILDETFYLDAFHKRKLKEEFDVEPWTFEQRIGEAVIIPAGCPYQLKKIKSCVNVVVEFISPESASECIKLSDELRQLPVNHKAKGKMLEVKKMTIYSVNAAIEEIRKVSQPEVNDEVGE